MYLAIVSLVPEDGTAVPYLDAQVLIDVLWAVSTAADAVEHIAARTVPGQADVGLYLEARSPDAADRAAHELLERATASAPALRGWRVRQTRSRNDPAAGD